MNGMERRDRKKQKKKMLPRQHWDVPITIGSIYGFSYEVIRLNCHARESNGKRKKKKTAIFNTDLMRKNERIQTWKKMSYFIRQSNFNCFILPFTLQIYFDRLFHLFLFFLFYFAAQTNRFVFPFHWIFANGL